MIRRDLMHKLFALAMSLVFIVGMAGANTYYIDIKGGSNANSGTSKTSAWKSAPGMQQSSNCGGPTHAYTPGSDNFIFEGGAGETWPAACFGITVPVGMTGDYWGVDKTWFQGSAWTQPLWDMNYTGIANGIIFQTANGDLGSHTIDNFEIAHQLVTIYPGMFDDQEAFKFYYGGGGTVLENLNVHDWASNSDVTPAICAGQGCFSYDIGGVLGSQNVADPSPSQGVRVLNSKFTDQGGYFFSGAPKINAGFGGACKDCAEVGGSPQGTLGFGYSSKFGFGAAGCFDTRVCDNTEFTDVNDGAIEQYDAPAPYGLHSQIIEDDAGGNSINYGNYLHNSPHAAVGMLVCAGSPVMNSILSGLANNYAIIIDTNGCGGASTATTFITGNTIDATVNGECIEYYRPGATQGTVNEYNNVCINGGNNVAANITHYNHSNNRTMTSSEANQYGFTSATMYQPTSQDPNTVGQGIVLTSDCTGNLTEICMDVLGNQRLSSWDLGAYQSGGNGPVRPNPPTNVIATVQ